MSTRLPPLRLTGATTLRDGAMIARTVAIADGRIATGPFPAVDLSGFLVMPGIVDISAQLPQSAFQPSGLTRLIRAMASSGVTTGWMRHSWGGLSTGQSALAAQAIAARLSAESPIDLRLQLQAETLAEDDPAALAQMIDARAADMVLFADTLSQDLAAAETDPEGFAQQQRAQGADPAASLAALRSAQDRRRDAPRRLCRMAERFDQAGVLYGSFGDPDGETRETYSLLGAKLCVAPRAGTAAGVAYAVGDPVILPAPALNTTAKGAPNLRALVQSGRCRALCSDTDPNALLDAVFALSESGLCSLAQAWALISTHPARFMRLPDRGEIAPGKRADLTIVDPRTRTVAATISAGRLVYAYGEVIARFIAAGNALSLAAE